MCNAVKQKLTMTVVWDVAPCGLVEINRRFRGAYCLHYQANPPRPDDGAVSTSETSVNFYQTTRRNIPDDSHLHIRRCGNRNSHQVETDSRNIISYRYYSNIMHAPVNTTVKL
jgi:hypothetical protein